MLERLQSQAMREVVGEPFVLAALRARRAAIAGVWRDALKPALRPVASVYGLIIGTLLSGSFAVEVITAWPGIGRLMLDALRARDVYLVAGCAGSRRAVPRVRHARVGRRARSVIRVPRLQTRRDPPRRSAEL